MQSPDDVEKGNAVESRITYSPLTPKVSSPHHPEPRTRLPIEFRTVSIHVETRVSETGGKEEDKRQRVVKGLVNPHTSTFMVLMSIELHRAECPGLAQDPHRGSPYSSGRFP